MFLTERPQKIWMTLWMSLLKVGLTLWVLVSLVGCGGMGPMKNVTDENPSAQGAPTPVPVPAGQAFALGAVGDLSANLSTVRDIQVGVTASADFSGEVEILVERDELDLVDNSNGVAISVTPSRVNLQKGQTQYVNLRVETRSQAPDFNDHFHLVAREAGVANPRLSTSVVAYKINPIIEVDLHGGAAPEVYAPMFSSLLVKPHVGGVTVRFINRDSDQTHIIHGQGAIPHQNTGTPLARANGNTPGGVYEVKVTSTTANLVGQFYCHSHESGAQARSLTFNAQ